MPTPVTLNPSCAQLISQGYDKDCACEPKKGFGPVAIILNYDDIDWDNVVVDASANIITTLPLKAGGKVGYKVAQFKNPFQGTVRNLNDGTYLRSWDKTFMFVTLTRDAAQNLNLNDPMANGKFVALVRNEDPGRKGECRWEILGYHNGLQLTACDQDAYGDAYGGDVFTLKEEFAARSSMYLFNTDVPTTEAAVLGYLTPTQNAA